MLLLLWMALPPSTSLKEVWYNMATSGPFRPTTAVTYLANCVNFTQSAEVLTDFALTGWPQTLLVTNVGNAATFFAIQTQVEFDDWSPLSGTFLFAGDSVLYTINSPASDANQDSSADPLVVNTFGFGDTNIAITGGLTQ
jgi:hypothetical protein